jgi:hypothetical protein
MALDDRPKDPVRVPLHTQPLGIFGSFRTARRNVLELIPQVATRVPILSGVTGKCWHMVMDPTALKRILRDKVDDYPKSVVTKLILGPPSGKAFLWPKGPTGNANAARPPQCSRTAM